jgi:hypothetical protein
MNLKRQYSYKFSAFEEIHVFHRVLGQPPGTAKGGRVSNDALWVRSVTGIQLNHTTDLQDAGRFLGNAAMAPRAAHVRTGDDRYSDSEGRPPTGGGQGDAALDLRPVRR